MENKNKHGMIIIKMTEPQPLDCPKCQAKEGYQYSDLFRMSYTSVHNAQGKYEGGEYSDGVCLNRGISCFCANCGNRLPFKLDRSGTRGVSVE